MRARTGGGPRVAPVQPDEVPGGIPEDAGDTRAAHGRFGRGNKISAKGGRHKAGATKLARRLGLNSEALEAFRPYKSAAVKFRAVHVNELASSVGGGFCGAGPASIVATASWQLAASRWLFDLGAANGDAELMLQASKLGNDSRQNLLAAHELTAREGIARRARERLAPGAQLLAAISQQPEGEQTSRPEGAMGGVYGGAYGAPTEPPLPSEEAGRCGGDAPLTSRQGLKPSKSQRKAQ